MQKLVLIGIDPGIRDTALVAMTINVPGRTVTTRTRVWSNVVTRNQGTFHVSEDFLRDLRAFVDMCILGYQVKFMGVEGYRQRGRDIRQDQGMLALIQAIRHTLPSSVVIDNTGIKKIVTEDMLKLFRLNRFQERTYHADLKSAARVALKLGIQKEQVNEVLSDFVRDNLGENQWRFSLM